jgi:hypothetical protein
MNPTGRIIHVLRFQTIRSCFSRIAAFPQRIDDLCPAQTQNNNLDKLGNFQKTGITEIPTVPQTGRKVDAIKANLAKIKLPPGFKISLYALVPDARHIAVGPQGVVTFVGTRKSKVYAVTDRGRPGLQRK